MNTPEYLDEVRSKYATGKATEHSYRPAIRRHYEKAYSNREGEPVHFVSIASFLGPLGLLHPLPGKFDELERQLRRFAEQKPISIRSAAKLAESRIMNEIKLPLGDGA